MYQENERVYKNKTLSGDSQGFVSGSFSLTCLLETFPPQKNIHVAIILHLIDRLSISNYLQTPTEWSLSSVGCHGNIEA